MLHNVDLDGKVKALSSSVLEKDQQMRELQAAFERLEAAKTLELEELAKVQKLATSGTAGRKQVKNEEEERRRNY